MIDLHTHILPGVDDGPRTVEQALAMARAAVAEGTVGLAATPHVRHDWPTRPETMERKVGELREALRQAGIPLEVLPGGEVDLEQLGLLAPDELSRFGLGGNPDYLLVEFPYVGWPLALESRVAALRARGVTAVIAHPERNTDVQAEPERLGTAVLEGALVQLTAASLDGRTGRRSRETAVALLELGLAHIVASDGHTPDIRGIGMGGVAAALGDDELARWLTREVPAAIVAGRRLPDRPARARRPRARLFRRSR